MKKYWTQILKPTLKITAKLIIPTLINQLKELVAQTYKYYKDTDYTLIEKKAKEIEQFEKDLNYIPIETEENK